ncbi:MAG TPA: preprotein translocase subunit SecG, partial [Candidatus Saccharimonadales bacterium]|nr:preprotein translocase subunit SecG [Candidatus Saccharimonadales bacterium]
MYVLILFIHILVCFGLMISILLQSGKGGSLAGAFGVGGGSQTLFGSRGATTFLTRATQWLGVTFFVTSLVLALISRGTSSAPRSLLQRTGAAGSPLRQGPAPAPAAPAS